MRDNEIFERLKKIIVRELSNVKEDLVTLNASFLEDLNASSIEIFDLILAIEDEFGIEVPDEDAIKITKVKDAVEYLKTKVS